MRQINDKQYSQFTAKERLNLTIAALSRNDETEADRLWHTCPRYSYRAHDFEYTLGVNAVFFLRAVFFEECVFHYNLVKKVETSILSYEQDLEFEEKEYLNELGTQTKKLIAIANKAQAICIARIKGLFEGFNSFCSDIGLYGESILKTMAIKNCCHDLDILLSMDIETDISYAIQVKKFFSDSWYF
jgi:hypothetical protein